jgi:hypothetical protein
MNIKRTTVLLISAVVIAAISFVIGIVCGGQIARRSIESELVWYNRGLLKTAVDDMKKGDTAAAKEKIMRVHAELAKMVEKG